jgi:hypothetical protein
MSLFAFGRWEDVLKRGRARRPAGILLHTFAGRRLMIIEIISFSHSQAPIFLEGWGFFYSFL